ncbi:hypothetical protein GCM10027048_17670 [Hymenobacter coalescens]
MKTSSWLKAFVLSGALLPATSSFAVVLQQGPTAPTTGSVERLGAHRKGNGEVKAYVQQNVLPVVRQQRQKLEGQLSAADKTQLTAYRTQLRTLREQGRALRKSWHPADAQARGQRPALTDAQKQQLQQLRTEQRAVMQNVAQLAQKYEPQISQLKAEVQPQRDKWEADIKALVQKNVTPEQQQKRQQWAEKGRGHHGKGHFGGLKQNYFGPTRFLLLDPNAPVKTEPADRGGRAALYPNPASTSQRLAYEVKKEGNVKIELLDERGKTLRTVFEGKQAKGPQSLDVNLADLQAGTYYYKITGKGATETRRFVKE